VSLFSLLLETNMPRRLRWLRNTLQGVNLIYFLFSLTIPDWVSYEWISQTKIWHLVLVYFGISCAFYALCAVSCVILC
jgi:hypothetical protein